MVRKYFKMGKLVIWGSCICIFPSYDRKYFFSNPNQHYPQLVALEPWLKYAHDSQAISISYTFMVADYRSSTTTLSYKSLRLFGEVSTYIATALLHYSTSHASMDSQHFWWQQCFFRTLTNVSLHDVLSSYTIRRQQWKSCSTYQDRGCSVPGWWMVRTRFWKVSETIPLSIWVP